MREPAWMQVARSKIGTKEIPGPVHNNVLLQFLNTAAKFNGVTWKNDEMPWCGGFVAACLNVVGIEPVKIAARAKSWETYGQRLRPERLAPGAILVFNRQGGGHVGFYVGEDATRYYVLGGNQSNMVCITPILKNRLSASRWPTGIAVTGGPTQYASTAAASRNEA